MPNPLKFLLLLALLVHGLAAAQTPVSVVRPDVVQAAETLRFTGTLLARESARLSPRVAGLVDQLDVDVGDRVVQGQRLLRLDARLAELDLAQSEAALNEARAALAEARRLAEEGRRLVSDRFLPDTEVRAREARVLLAEAALARFQAELDSARQRLDDHALSAPFDGVIASRQVERGEWVVPGTPVFELIGLDELWLDARVPQRHWSALADRQVTLRAFADVAPDRALDARIHARVPVNDPTARTFLLRLLIEDPDAALTPGMSARVELDLLSDGQVTLIPRDALLRYPDGSTVVWLVDVGSDQAYQQAVEVRRLLADQAELADALPSGARVVVRGNEGLSEGESVRIVEGND